MSYAILLGNFVSNIVEAEAGFAASQGWIDATGASIGDTWDGKKFLPPDPEVVKEKARLGMVTTPWRIREALTQKGWREALEQAITQASRSAQDAWHYAQEFKRLDPLVLEMAGVLKKTPDEVDELFTLANSLPL